MLKELRQEDAYQEVLRTVILMLEKKGYDGIQADYPGYEKPSNIIRQNDQITFVPDLTANRRGHKCYFEISERTKDISKLVGKWKMLARLAVIKNGEFSILVPKGKLRFTQNLMEDHKIQAEIIKV